MIAGGARRAARIRAAAIIAIAAALYLPSMWTRDLWDPDEPKYAEASREMTSMGDFILPHLNGDVYSEKPPLFFWLSVAASHLPGIPPGSEGRLVSWLAATGTMLLTWRIGAIVMGEATGALAAVLLGTSVLFWQLSQSGIIDPLLTLLCTSALYGYTRHRCGQRIGMPIFYLSCSLGVLAKGPVALLIPALAAMTYTAAVDGFSALRARHPLWGIPLVAAPVSLWLAAATARGGASYAETMLFKQNVGRAFNAFIHKQPLTYFVAALPISFLPWTLFLPQALVAGFREKIDRVRPMLFPFVWFSSTFVLFSLISGKKTRYMMPLLPAAALLVAGWMMRRFFSPDGRIRNGRGVLLAASAAGILLATALAAPALLGERALPDSLLRSMSEPGSEAALSSIEACLVWPGCLALLVPSFLLGGACAWSFVLALRSRGIAFPALLAGWTFFLVATGLLWTPVVNRIKSAAPLAEKIRSLAGEGPLYYFRSIHAGKLNYLLERDRIPVLHTASQIREAASAGRARFIADRRELYRLEKKEGLSCDIDACRRVGEITLCVATFRSDSLSD